MALTLDNVTFLLTGDAEGEVWDVIADDIPDTTRVVKVPHHGSRNGSINPHGRSWTDRTDGLQPQPRLAISCHPNFPNRYDFPHDDVLQVLDAGSHEYDRTDENYHLTYWTDGTDVTVKCSRA